MKPCGKRKFISLSIHSVQQEAWSTRGPGDGPTAPGGNKRQRIFDPPPRKENLALRARGLAPQTMAARLSHDPWECEAGTTAPCVHPGSLPVCSHFNAMSQRVFSKRLWKKAKCPISAAPIDAGETRRWVAGLFVK